MHCLVYVTAADRNEAETIGARAVDERLAACANVLGDITSVFWWDGGVQKEGEVALILKTTENRLGELIAMVKSVHSYSCPCVVALPIVGGNDDFLHWLHTETDPKGRRD